MSAPRFRVVLALVVAIGLTLRLIYLFAAPLTLISGDGSYFHLGANYLVDGLGFLDPFTYAYSLETNRIPGAEHPPVWTIVLAIPSLLGFTTRLEHQVFATLVGTATIVVMGCAGRRLAGPRAGLIAAAITALYPGFWLYERQLLSETLTIFEAALVVLLALRFRAEPTWPRALTVGIVCGALALTRTEMVLLIGLLLVPLMLFAPAVSWQRRVGWLTLAGTAAAVVMAPWVVYNLQRFDEPVLISSQGGRTLAASNCDRTYHGRLLGYKDLFNPGCGRRLELFGPDVSGSVRVPAAVQARGNDGSWADAELRRLASQYIRSHRDRLPVVVVAREGRTWGLFRPFQQLRLDLIRGDIWFLWLAYFCYLAMVPAAISGAVILLRRRAPLWPLLALILTVAITVAITFGSTRYRAPADVAIALLAAVAIDAAASAMSPRRRPAVDVEPAKTPERVPAGTS